MASRPLRTDNDGRAYALLSGLRDGQRVELDTGLDCIKHEPGIPSTRTVLADDNGKLYFVCEDGRHYLDGQRDAPDSDALIGVYPAHNGCAFHG